MCRKIAFAEVPLFLVRAAFENRDDGVEREADGAESGQYARRNEVFGFEQHRFVEERGEEKARQRREYRNDRDAVGQREIGVPDFRQQDHLARNAPADQRQSDQYEAHEIDRLAPECEDHDQPQHESQSAHAEYQTHPAAAFAHRVAATCLTGDAGDQRDQRGADAGDAEHDAARDDVGRKGSDRKQQDAPEPCSRGHGRYDEDQQRALSARESRGIDREAAVA